MKQNLNPMMDQPIVDKKVLHWMRYIQRPLSGDLGILERESYQNRVPIIPHETVVFLQFLLTMHQPKYILEIGTAVGFSSSLFANYLQEGGCVTTIERNPKMIQKAKETYQQLNNQHQINLLEGDAVDHLDQLPAERFDFIFMDSAKAKYIEFLPKCLRVMKATGILVIDDIFQGGTVFDPETEISRRNRSIHRKLNQLLETVNFDPTLIISAVPLGDGLLLIQKNNK